jgi:hypothetical protein
MKCFNHATAEAVAVCAHCGRGLCADCSRTQTSSRIACSAECASALSRADESFHQLEVITRQLRDSARASAFYCYVCAGLSAAAAVVAWFLLPSTFLILFTSGCAVVLLLAGIWYGRGGGKRTT